MGDASSTKNSHWREYCVENQAFPTFGIMEPRPNEGNTCMYFPTLKEFADRVMELTWQQEDANLNQGFPIFQLCENEAAKYIIAGFSNFWKQQFQYEEGTAFSDILNAADEYADQEAAWIAQHHPAKPVVIKPCSVRLRSVVVLPDNRRNQEPLRSQLPTVLEEEEEDVDIVLLMDEEPIPLPPTKDLQCFKCGHEGHIARECPNPTDKSVYTNRRAVDPYFDQKERLRKKRNNKAHRSRQRRIAAYIRANDVD
ncbi:unnamed protein product [Allacma fusca]|uniref:CCHC-type domain-containing protein n=1 Tax=Allacma fusca TaxID=39272 RepID=A0A8J2P053_9HEXA|nr:unnamed protein product [Allacma fusca]